MVRWTQGSPYGTSAIPYIGENGNWWVNQEDTGVQAQGPQGVQGERGRAGIGVPGPALTYEDLTEEQKQDLVTHLTPQMQAIKDSAVEETTALVNAAQAEVDKAATEVTKAAAEVTKASNEATKAAGSATTASGLADAAAASAQEAAASAALAATLTPEYALNENIVEAIYMDGKNDGMDTITQFTNTTSDEVLWIDTLYGRTYQEATPTPTAPQVMNSVGMTNTELYTHPTDSGTPQYSTAVSNSRTDVLYGIPVSSGGNYVDADTQEWLCDYITSAVIGCVKHSYFAQQRFRGGTDDGWVYSTVDSVALFSVVIFNAKVAPFMCSAFEFVELPAGNTGSLLNDLQCSVYNNDGASTFVFRYDAITSLDNWLTFLSTLAYGTNTGLNILYQRKEPYSTTYSNADSFWKNGRQHLTLCDSATLVGLSNTTVLYVPSARLLRGTCEAGRRLLKAMAAASVTAYNAYSIDTRYGALFSLSTSTVQANLAAGETTLTLTNNLFSSSNRVIDIYTNVFGVNPKTVVQDTTAKTLTLTFDAQTVNVAVRVRAY